MASKNKYFEPKFYYYKVLVMCFMIIVDIIFNSFTQFLTFGQVNKCDKRDDIYLCIGIAIFQFIIIMVMVFVLLSVFSQTFFFKQGLLGVICKQFVFSLVCLFCYPVLFIVERAILGIKLDLDKKKGAPINKIFTSYYTAFYVLKYISAFLFYMGLLSTSFELGKSKYYKIDLSLISP